MSDFMSLIDEQTPLDLMVPPRNSNESVFLADRGVKARVFSHHRATGCGRIVVSDGKQMVGDSAMTPDELRAFGLACFRVAAELENSDA